MPKIKLVKFSSIAGAEMRWRYEKRYLYGDGRPGARNLRRTVLDKLIACFMEMGFLCALGMPDKIVSAGARVPQSGKRGPKDKHVLGRAIDIDALWWTEWAGVMVSPRILVANRYEDCPAFYLGVEAQFRRYFGTVLGFLYNKAHEGHWHIDDGSRVCYRASSKSRVLFVQASLRHIWRYNISIDGTAGPQTRGVIAAVSERLHITKPLTDSASWQRYLLSTAVKGMEEVDTLSKSL